MVCNHGKMVGKLRKKMVCNSIKKGKRSCGVSNKMLRKC